MKQCFFVLNLQKRNYFVLIAPYCGKNPTKFCFSSSSRTFVFRSILYTFVLLDKEVNIHRQCGDIRNNKKSRFMYSTHCKPTSYMMSFVCFCMWDHSQNKGCQGKTTLGSIDTHRAADSFLQTFPAAISFDSIRGRCLHFQIFAAVALLQKLTFMLQLCDLGWRGQNLEAQVVKIKPADHH